MAQEDKTKEEFIEEIKLLQKRIAEFEILDSERKQQHHQDMRRLATVVRDSNDAIMIQDIGGRITDWNRGAELMYGYSEKEAFGMNIERLTPPGKVAEQKEFTRSLIAGQALTSFESQRVTKDGRILDVWLTVTKVMDDTGRPIGIASTERDITELKKHEEQIRHAAEEWRTTFDSITDLISIIDRESRLVRVNKALAHAFGVDPKDVIGKTCYELMCGSKGPCPDCPHKKTLETGIPTTAEFFNPLLKIPLEVSVSPIFDDKGKVVATVYAAKDITQRKEMEKSQRLSQLGKLVADMAHEVNNPLMIVSGNAQLCLMEEIQNDAVKNNLKIIVEECRRAKNIIQRLLKFSRPSKGEIKEVDINKCIEAVVGIVEHQFKLVNVEIKRNYLETLPLISVDEQQMQEVFMNLINNAVEAMPGGGVITITTSLEGDFLRLDFKDTGSGMSEEVKKKALEPFFTTKDKGTGLGLAVCYGIIRAHNGEIRFENELNKGTTVTVLLPWGG